ncbi:MAG: acylphosphatase, partial [Limisphaerales bacterium]
QGVGFRYFTARVAHELGVSGWARNLSDGRVEVHAKGTARQLDEFEARLREGPPAAQVRGVEIRGTAISDADGFHIR